MSSVSLSAAAPTATSIMDLEMESSMETMIMDETVSTAVRSAVPTSAPAAGASGADFSALEEAFPPCAMDCVMRFPTLDAACANAATIKQCGDSACTGPDLTRFDAVLLTVAPLCEGVAAGSTQGTAAASAPRSTGNAATGTASAAVKTNGTKAAAATGTATKAATTAAKKDSSASMMNVFGLFASAVALLVL